MCSDCVTVQWQKELYTIFEDFEKPIPPKKTLNAVVELLDGPVGYDITIYYRTIDGTAIGGSDFPAGDKCNCYIESWRDKCNCSNRKL